jgi:hypothetical protein
MPEHLSTLFFEHERHDIKRYLGQSNSERVVVHASAGQDGRGQAKTRTTNAAGLDKWDKMVKDT